MPTGGERIVGSREPDRLVTQRREHVLIPEQLLALVIDHQHRLALSERQRSEIPGVNRRAGGAAGQPDLEAAAGAGRAPDVHDAAVVAHDFIHRREPQTVAGGAGGEERFEDLPQSRVVHAATAVAYGYSHVAAWGEIAAKQTKRRCDFADIGADLDAARSVHRLRRVGAKIEDHLLQLGGFAVDDGGVRNLRDGQLDARWKRSAEQGRGLEDQISHPRQAAARVAPPAERKDLPDQNARPFRRPQDLAEIVRGQAVLRDLRLGDFGVADDRAENIVEVVGDAAGESPDRLQAAGLLQPRLETFFLAFEKLPVDGVDNGVERHAHQAEFAWARDTATLSHGVEAQCDVDAVFADAGAARPTS